MKTTGSKTTEGDSGSVRAGRDAYSAMPAIARRSVEAAVSGIEFLPGRGTSRLPHPAPVFVTIRTRDGQLRGCVGTLTPTCSDVADEVARMARAAAFGDRRFQPVRRAELAELRYEVSVLSEPEPADESDLDPAVFGVVVNASDGRRGVMLPGVPDLDTVEQQLAATRRKAGIAADAPVTLERFRMVKVEEPDDPTP